jgi:hypothetical protein
MLKYKSSANYRHSTSSPQIDSMFLMAKLSTVATISALQTEKDQIDSIRSLGKYLLGEEA